MAKATNLQQLELHARRSKAYTDEKVAELGESVVNTAEEQSLTDEQKERVRKNIGALAAGDVSLGFHTDGLLYVFVNGAPVGEGMRLVRKYPISYNMFNCTISNNATEIVEGESYTATITPTPGCELKDISVAMGSGLNISDTVVSGNTITIPKVTSWVQISAAALQK